MSEHEIQESRAAIAFIGAGNMASSIIGGLIANGFAPSNIIASDPHAESLQALATKSGIIAASDNNEAVENAEVVILAVKPQVMGAVCEALADAIPASALIISIAAGITCGSLDQWLRGSRPDRSARPLVRCMPNTPALVLAGASALYATAEVDVEQRAKAQAILAAVGTVDWVDSEADIDAVTAVSGSGPAYFFLLMEAMIDSGVAQGLTRDTATTLAFQTAYGAAKLAKNSDVDVAELRRRVTSPNGTTHEAITSFEKNGFRAIVDEAMVACADRSRSLARELGGPS